MAERSVSKGMSQRLQTALYYSRKRKRLARQAAQQEQQADPDPEG